MEQVVILLAIVLAMLAALCGFLGFWVRDLLQERAARETVEKLRALEKKLILRGPPSESGSQVTVDVGTIYDNKRVRSGMNTETTVKLPVLKEPLTEEQIKAQDDFHRQMTAEEDFPASDSLNEDKTKKLPDE